MSGVYGFTRETFLRALRVADVGIVVDVRQRRGVRGAEYAWANSRRLQAALADSRRRLSPPSRPRADDRAASAPVPRGRPARRRQAVACRARPRLPAALYDRDPRPGRSRSAPRSDSVPDGASPSLRRARPRGLPPVGHRRAAGRGARRAHHASPALTVPFPTPPAGGGAVASAARARRSRPRGPASKLRLGVGSIPSSRLAAVVEDSRDRVPQVSEQADDTWATE